MARGFGRQNQSARNAVTKEGEGKGKCGADNKGGDQRPPPPPKGDGGEGGGKNGSKSPPPPPNKAGGAPPPKKNILEMSDAEKAKVPCLFHAQGKCSAGGACKFKHENKPDATAAKKD